MSYNPAHTAASYDEYGERQWTRFEDGRTPAPSLAVHLDFLGRFISAGDRVLDIGADPGRFTIELARLGADIVVADISAGQLALNRDRVGAAGAVCFGGPLSYVLDRAEDGVAELVRVTAPAGTSSSPLCRSPTRSSTSFPRSSSSRGGTESS